MALNANTWRTATDSGRLAAVNLRNTSSLSLRWRVMMLAMSMVAMVVVLMAVAVYAVVSRALYDDLDNQLHSRARLLIESGSLAADPGKAIEGTAYSDVNAMLVIPGRSIYTANQQGQMLPLGKAEKDVISGELLMSLRTANHQRVLAVHLANGSSPADLQEPGAHGPSAETSGHGAAHRRWCRRGGGGHGRWSGGQSRAQTGGQTHRSRRAGGPHRRPAAHPGDRQ